MFFITGCANHGTLLFVNSYATVLRVATIIPSGHTLLGFTSQQGGIICLVVAF